MKTKITCYADTTLDEYLEKRETLRGNTIRNQDKEKRLTKASIQLSTHSAFRDSLPIFSQEPKKAPKLISVHSLNLYLMPTLCLHQIPPQREMQH